MLIKSITAMEKGGNFCMEIAIKDRFVFTYESGVNGSFLVASTTKNDNIIEFQVNMLNKNPNKHILPLDVRRNNDKINIYYNITSKLSLSQYLKRRQLSRNEFLDIFSGIIMTLQSSKALLLSDNSFILDEEYIYVNPDTMNVSFVYLPVKLDIDITKALRDFAMNFVVYSANIIEENSDAFLQQFLSFLKKDTFNILDFDKFLKEVKRSVSQQENELQKSSDMMEDKQVSVNIEKQAKTENDSKQNKANIDIPKPKSNPTKDSRNNISPSNVESKSEAKKSNVSIEPSVLKKFTDRPNLVIGAVIQAVLVIAIIVMLLAGTLDFLGNDKATTAFGLLLVCAAVSYFMWKKVLAMQIATADNKTGDNKIPSSKSAANKPAVNKPPVNKPAINRPEVIKPVVNKSNADKPDTNKPTDNKASKASFPRPQVKPNVAPNYNDPDKTAPKDLKKHKAEETEMNNVLPKTPQIAAQKEQNTDVESEIKSVNTPVISSSSVSETVFLGNSFKRNPILKVVKTGSVEEIVIDKPSFIIGRLEGQVDYVHSNNAIGKVHAEIITREGCYYLKDLNSKNGSFINGKRIESNTEYQIKNNDKITLANSDFVFIVL